VSLGDIENTNPILRALMIGKNEPKPAQRRMPLGRVENTNPMGGFWVLRRPAISSFQVTVGRRFEHLAARKNRRLTAKSIFDLTGLPGLVQTPARRDRRKLV